MKAWKVSLAIATMVAFSASAAAQCCSKGKDAAKAKAATTAVKTETEAGRCWGKAVAATGMPLLKYKVGGECTACPVQAKELAQKDASAKTIYLVGEKEYKDQSEAMTAYATALQSYLDETTQVRFAVGKECVACPQHAKQLADAQGEPMRFRVASYNFDSQEQAERASKTAREASDGVTLKMVVDGKEYDCSKTCFQGAGDGCCAGKPAASACCGGKPGCDGGKEGCAAGKAADKGNKADGAKTASNEGTKESAGKSGCGSKSAKTASGCCPKSGGAKQVIAGKTCEYIVGDQKTACQQTARIQWMQARIVAAHRAVAELNGQDVAGL